MCIRDRDIEPFILQVQQLNSIYGISTTASCAIIAEIGVDMKPFKTAEHICSWAGLCPGNNESAGKRKSTSVTKGNPYIKSCLLYTSHFIFSDTEGGRSTCGRDGHHASGA